jgi:hypothetical protein
MAFKYPGRMRPGPSNVQPVHGVWVLQRLGFGPGRILEGPNMLERPDVAEPGVWPASGHSLSSRGTGL